LTFIENRLVDGHVISFRCSGDPLSISFISYERTITQIFVLCITGFSGQVFSK